MSKTLLVRSAGRRRALSAGLAATLALAACDRAPESTGPASGSSLQSASGAQLNSAFSPDFKYHHLSRDEATQLYPLRGTDYRYDPIAGYVNRPEQDVPYALDEHAGGQFRVRTNSLSMREDEEPAAVKPGLRVLVTGDSHTDGACDNAESWANQLEAMLAARKPGRSVEVLNAGTGSYSFYNYLGVLEKHLELDPDVFVVCAYGGNDWLEVLAPWHLFQGSERPQSEGDYWERIKRAQAAHRGWGKEAISQAYNQYLYLQFHPAQAEIALRAGVIVMREIERLCRAKGIKLVCAYLPPASEVQYALHRDGFDEVGRALGLEPTAVELTSKLADSFLAHLKQLGIAAVDLRPAFQRANEPLYWKSDLHINVRGHQEVARELLPLVDPGA